MLVCFLRRRIPAGGIPAELTQLHNLQNLSLSSNQLNGKVNTDVNV